ncbi:MAG: 23S rRNA (adenine2503-C2)-methyltransferase [Cryomorphaceae bacterium]|jgi:23S rRNA (adenine2503-C2)-methyltransferase
MPTEIVIDVLDVNQPKRENLMGFDREAMEEYFLSIGEKSFRAAQVMKWIHQVGVSDFTQMTNLSKTLRARLSDTAEVRLPEIISDELSEDGTRKWLLKVPGKSAIEMVFIPEESRGTLCVSSQVGCTLNCSFCATGKQGYNRDLTTAEIIGQVWLAKTMLAEQHQTDQRIVSNVVMMGMGEPLMNFDNVVSAMKIMQDDFCFGLSKRRITLSTAGVVPKIDQLKEACPVSLAVSLHAPNDELRNELVPLNKKYPIKDLLDACNRYVADSARSRITFEYVMLEGINDDIEHAKQLAELMKTVPGKVNLIPFNSFEGIDYKRSSNTRINRFRDILHSNGVIATVRRTRGDDIEAACGQLAGDVMDRTRRSEKFRQKQAEKIQ